MANKVEQMWLKDKETEKDGAWEGGIEAHVMNFKCTKCTNPFLTPAFQRAEGWEEMHTTMSAHQ